MKDFEVVVINTVEEVDNFTCYCGNVAYTSGFEACDDEGNIVEPLPEWGGKLYCNGCGRIFLWVDKTGVE